MQDGNLTMEDLKEWRLAYRPSQVMRMLDVDKNMVYRLIQLNYIRAIKINGYYRIKREHFESFLQNYCMNDTGEFRVDTLKAWKRAYKPKKVMELLDLSKSALYNLISKGKLSAMKVGRLYRIKKSSIERFLKEHGTTEYCFEDEFEAGSFD